MLRDVLPVLLSESVNFKLVSSLSALSHLNAGNGGPTQVGKFITIYPNDDAQAVRLAVALAEATRGLAGPMIASDRQLRRDSRVSYRYGGFDHLVLQTAIGEVLPALRAPDGRLVPDRRALYYDPPHWAVDPFVAAGVATPPPAPDVVVGGRYALVSTLYRSPRGALYLAVDLDAARRSVLKRARRHAMEGPDGRDARDRLHGEARALAALAPDPRFPAVFDLFEDGGDLYLALEDVEGETLEHQIHERTAQGRIASTAEVIAWGRELAAMLHTAHARGFLSRDVKPSNVIVAPDGRLRLIDFDIAHCMTDPAPRSGKGTRGYFSPQQHVAEVPAVTDDIYGLGALLYFLATSAEPSQAPDQFALLDRPPALLNPAISPALERVIARCLDPDPAKRYPSMQAVEAALAVAGTAPSLPAPAFDGERVLEPSVEAQRRHRALAQRLADTICGAAQPAPNGQGLAWATRHPVSAGGVHTRDLNAGNAGTLLALAELAAVFADPAHRTTLAEGARWLAMAPPFEGELLPGLYVGEAGIGAALLRAGQVLGDAALIAAAAERGRLVASLPFRSPDLFNGTAGRLRFHLLLWDETGAADHLAAAVRAGASLLAVAQDTGNGGICWPMPSDFEGLTGAAYLGYAHGAAGIADALLDLYEATGDTRLRDAARGAARWLTRLAQPTLGVSSDRRGLGKGYQPSVRTPDGAGRGRSEPALSSAKGSPSLKDGGLGWPAVEGQAPSAPFWCHGAAGIGRFFLHAARLG
ncbi:MAG: lanthionine synthetase LanC family protein, partial [Dehalococcoidia bacterium]